jgi:X-X-X-Leu-X-X-Gly heptad repeat protein
LASKQLMILTGFSGGAEEAEGLATGAEGLVTGPCLASGAEGLATGAEGLATGANDLASGADGLAVGADGLAARAKDREEGLETLECLDLVVEIEVPSDGLTIGLEEPNMLCIPDICWLGLNIIW